MRLPWSRAGEAEALAAFTTAARGVPGVVAVDLAYRHLPQRSAALGGTVTLHAPDRASALAGYAAVLEACWAASGRARLDRADAITVYVDALADGGLRVGATDLGLRPRPTLAEVHDLLRA